MTPFLERLHRLAPTVEYARHETWYGDDVTCERIVRLHRHAVSLWHKGKVRVAHNILDEIESITKGENA